MAHLIEPAPSGRAKCRACKQPIAKGRLRLSEEVPNAFGEGTAAHFYHLECGAYRRAEAFLLAAREFDIEAVPEQAEPLSGAELQRLLEVAEWGSRFYRLPRFVRAQVAPSGRARCQGCRELIEKGSLRFVLERIEDGMVSGAGFVHLGCAHAYAGAVTGIVERVRSLSAPGPADSGEATRQGSALTEEQWQEVKSQLAVQEALPLVMPVADATPSETPSAQSAPGADSEDS
jgi:hypothetical protein